MCFPKDGSGQDDLIKILNIKKGLVIEPGLLCGDSASYLPSMVTTTESLIIDILQLKKRNVIGFGRVILNQLIRTYHDNLLQ